MKTTKVLTDTYDNYSRLIKEIEENNKELKKLIESADDSYERLAYYDALIRNEGAINQIAKDRLKMTLEVFAS